MKNVQLPRWVGPAIRALCKEMDTGRAVPHIFAGVESLLFLPPPAEAKPKIEGKIAALIATVWFYVTMKLDGTPIDNRAFKERRRRVFGVLNGLQGDAAICEKVGDKKEGWEGWDIATNTDLTDRLAEITNEGWLDLEWYRNISDGGGASGKVDEEDEDSEEEDEEAKRAQKRKKEWGKNVGRGSMKQDQFDYLSEERLKAHAIWKDTMLAIIEKQIASGILHRDMDTTED